MNDIPLRLNLGSGAQFVPGWISLDRSPNLILSRVPLVKRLFRRLGVLSDAHMVHWDRSIRYQNIKSLPFPSDSVECVYSSHALEHLYLDEAQKVLEESARVLKSGGMIRLALPDTVHLARELIRQVDLGETGAGWTFNESLLAHPFARPHALRRLIFLAGGHVHRWQPVPSMVEQMLTDAGFHELQEREYQVGEFPDLLAIETRPSSFFLEGRRS